jgi:hypothetical protein
LGRLCVIPRMAATLAGPDLSSIAQAEWKSMLT